MRMGTTTAIPAGTCFWCQEREADSREHKFKRSDLVREHGRGELRDDRTLIRYGGQGRREMRGTNSEALKFRPSLCAHCNNTHSQPIDKAYDHFIEGVFAEEAKFLAQRQIDLEAILGADWRSSAEDVLRYFVKHALCRIAESRHGAEDAELPTDALAFLDGGPVPESLACEIWIEPTWLRFADVGKDDPSWVRWMGMDPLFGGPDGRVGGRWAYGWLVFGWEFWGEDPEHPFGERVAKLPIIATRTVDFELALMPTTARHQEDEPDREWLARVAGDDVVAPDHAVSRSPVCQAFAGGALDFEAATRDLGPDRREPMVEDPVADATVEIRRAGLLAGIARAVWAQSSVDVAQIRAVDLGPSQLDPAAIRAAVVPLEGVEADQGFKAIAKTFAAMSSLKLADALEMGVDSGERHEAVCTAALLAGRCAAAAGAAGGEWSECWDSVSAAVARVTRLG
jgi:hypothetical protein